MTPAARKALEELSAAWHRGDFSDAEIVCSGIECWLGERRTSWYVVQQLLRLTCVTQDMWGGSSHFIINSTGLSVVSRAELEDELRGAILAGKPFSIVNDHIELLDAQQKAFDARLPKGS